MPDAPPASPRPRGRLAEATPAARALRQLERSGDTVLAVVAGGRARGVIEAALLRRAVELGLGGMRIGDLWSPRPARGTRRGAAGAAARLSRILADVDRRRLRRLGRIAAARGARAFLVGGVVRDALLGLRRGGTDLDVVVVGDALGVARRLARARGARLRTHPDFGTATVAFPRGLAIDLAESRRERYARPGALPRVTPGDLADDLARRDFGVNAIAVALGPRSFGRLVDPCAGGEDLRLRRVRVLHGLSLIDDPTRVFRALRLSHRSGLSIERRTAELIRVACRRRVFDTISPARLCRELSLLFGERDWGALVLRLDRFGLWVGARLAPAGVGRWTTALRRLERWSIRFGASEASGERWATVLALLNADRRPAARAALVHRLRPARAAAAALVEAPVRARRTLGALQRLPRLRASAVHRICRREREESLLLAGALCERRAIRAALSRYLSRSRHVRCDIDGGDLLAAGVARGKAIGAGLEAALAAKLDRRTISRKRQLARALSASRGASA